MKKKVQKLDLSRETLRALRSDWQPGQVVGGYTGGGPTCPHSCFKTLCTCG
jgi:hypothetical protein